MRSIVNSPRVLVTWTPRSEWARIAGRWFSGELGATSRCAYARALGLEVVVFSKPRR